MALLNASSNQSLADYGVNTGVDRPNLFKKVFIASQPREGQEVGKFHCYYAFQGDYVLNNESEINFIPLIMKQVREGYKETGQGPNRQRKLVYFSWMPHQDNEYPDFSRLAVILAGVYLDKNMKPVPNKEEDGKSAMIYFKCEGVKMGSYIDFSRKVAEVTSKMEPISDDSNYEQAVIAWRRHIVTASVGTGQTQYGTRYVFNFNLKQQIPDKQVVAFMEQSEKLLEPFKQQFDYTGQIQLPNNQGPMVAMPAPSWDQGSQQKQAESAPKESEPVAANDLTNLDLNL